MAATQAAARAARAAAQAAAQASSDASEYGDGSAKQTSRSINSSRNARAEFHRTAAEKQNTDHFDGKKTETEHGSYSTRAQWSERVARPVAARHMTIEQIAEFQAVLSIAEHVDDPSQIPWRVRRIRDYDDEERNDCLELCYFGDRVGERGHIVSRPIWTTKIPMPDELRMKAEKRMIDDFVKPPEPRTRKMYITSRHMQSHARGGAVSEEANAATEDIVSIVDTEIERAAADIADDSDASDDEAGGAASAGAVGALNNDLEEYASD